MSALHLIFPSAVVEGKMNFTETSVSCAHQSPTPTGNRSLIRWVTLCCERNNCFHVSPSEKKKPRFGHEGAARLDKTTEHLVFWLSEPVVSPVCCENSDPGAEHKSGCDGIMQ